MEEHELRTALKSLLYAVKTKHFPWRLDGTANLYVQGMDISVRDIDISTNNDGYRLFKKALGPGKEIENEKGRLLQTTINSSPVEIWQYQDHALRMFDQVQPLLWNELKIPVLPLPEAMQFYRLIHRLDRVEAIAKFLKEQPKRL